MAPPPTTKTGRQTFLDVLEWRATRHADRIAFRFLSDDDPGSAALTYGELSRRAKAIAASIKPHCKKRERALLLCPPGLDYVVSFLGCLYAQVMAVPLHPPRWNRGNPRIEAAVIDSEPALLLTTEGVLHRLDAHGAAFPYLADLPRLSTDQAATRDADDARHLPGSEDLAFLQYSSGSTSTPKGIVVSHGNLVANAAMMQRAFGWDEETVLVSWLPLFHDMGLMGTTLTPLYVGLTCIQMSHLAFLQHPVKWLQAVTRYRATSIAAPNFAYDLCTARITPEELSGLDLSTLEWAHSGSEPVRLETIERFSALFEPCGFRRNAFYPCYGLAEATLFVSGGRKEDPPVTYAASGAALGHRQVKDGDRETKDVRTLVGCGRADASGQIAIVDPDTLRLCRSDQIGEIWVAGPHVCQGYWKKPEETDRTFNAFLPENGAGPYLRTGDLGFLKNDELFVVGRLKDLIIFRGRNYYPQDLERTAQRAHPGLRPNRGAAFSVEVSGQDRVVLVNELVRHARDLDLDGVAGHVRAAVALEHDVTIHHIVLIKAGSIPMTTSGKVQRHACAKAFLRQELDCCTASHMASHPGSSVDAEDDGSVLGANMPMR